MNNLKDRLFLWLLHSLIVGNSKAGHNIIQLFRLVKEHTSTAFSEDNVYTVDDYLQEMFDVVKSKPVRRG